MPIKIAPLWNPGHAWAYPALEVAHIVGLALLLGSLVLVELRVFGRGKDLDAPRLAAVGLPLTLVGFALAAASGLLMFASQPGELINNRYFLWKMGLVMLAGINAAAFHARGSIHKLDTTAKAQAAFSTLLWISVIACGRWIAYA